MQELFKKLALMGDLWVLWILVISSIASFGIMIERWLIFRNNRIEFTKFLDNFVKRLEIADLTGARQLARSKPSVESRVALSGLSNHNNGLAAMEKTMTAKLIMERAQLEKNLIILSTLGNNAPFIGLFGTVLGIIKAFNDLSISGTSGVSVVMSGISSALIATALGIFVAIPAVAANNYFYSRVRRILANCQSLIDTMQSHIKDGQRFHSEEVETSLS